MNNEQIGKHSAHVNDQLYQYILQHTREPKVCALSIVMYFPSTNRALPKCCFSPEELS
jgi:hypothetical protein